MSHLYWREGSCRVVKRQEDPDPQASLKSNTTSNLEKLARRMFTLQHPQARRPEIEGGPSKELVDALRWLDTNVNVNWPLAHYKSAVRYLHKDPVDIAATGGTNWQKYLPPRFQKRIFFPEHWSDQELEEWGKRVGRQRRCSARIHDVVSEVMAVAMAAMLGRFWSCCGGGPTAQAGRRVAACSARQPNLSPRCGLGSCGTDCGGLRQGQVRPKLVPPSRPRGHWPRTCGHLAANSRPTGTFETQKAGREWWLASKAVRDSAASVRHGLCPRGCFYERNPKDYAVFIGDTLGVRLGSRNSRGYGLRPGTGDHRKQFVHGLRQGGHPTNLAVAMANVYAWTIDFSRGPRRRVRRLVPTDAKVNGEPVGMPKVVLSSRLHPLERPTRGLPLQKRRQRGVLRPRRRHPKGVPQGPGRIQPHLQAASTPSGFHRA